MMYRILFFSWLLSLSGCYSFSQTTLPPHLRTLTVLPTENRTTQSVLGDLLSQEIKTAFQKNASSLRQVPSGGSAELQITLTSYRNNPASYSTSGVVSTYQISLGVDVLFRDKIKNQDLYSQKNLSVSALYDISKGETEEIGQNRALKELKEVLINNALANW